MITLHWMGRMLRDLFFMGWVNRAWFMSLGILGLIFLGLIILGAKVAAPFIYTFFLAAGCRRSGNDALINRVHALQPAGAVKLLLKFVVAGRPHALNLFGVVGKFPDGLG